MTFVIFTTKQWPYVHSFYIEVYFTKRTENDFHELPFSLKMEVISQKRKENERNPVVFMHGSFRGQRLGNLIRVFLGNLQMKIMNFTDFNLGILLGFQLRFFLEI